MNGEEKISNIVFCGFGKLGKNCLGKLTAHGYRIDYILTHKELEEDSVDTFAIINNIPYSYKDARKNLDEISNIIKKIEPRFLICVNYRYILPKNVFAVPKYAINIHGSLLPKYRGRTPHVWSIINGEKMSGITSHIVEESVDTGDIILQKSIDIDCDDTGFTLLNKYQLEYPSLLCDSLIYLEEAKPLRMQREEDASYYGKRIPDMGYIDFYKNSIDVINFVRAQAEPYPGAYYYLVDGRKIIINKLTVDEKIDFNGPVGIIKKIGDSYYGKCKDANLKIENFRILDLNGG